MGVKKGNAGTTSWKKNDGPLIEGLDKVRRELEKIRAVMGRADGRLVQALDDIHALDPKIGAYLARAEHVQLLDAVSAAVRVLETQRQSFED